MDLHGQAELLGKLGLLDEVGRADAVWRMRSDRGRDQGVVTVLLGELPLFGHHVFGRRTPRGGEIDQRFRDDAAHPSSSEDGRDLVAEEVHVGRRCDAGEELLGDGELGAEPDRLTVHVGLLGRPDVVFQPIHELEIVREAAQQIHGEVGVGVDHARHDDAAGGVDHLTGRCVLEEVFGQPDRGDPAVGDGDRTVDDGLGVGFHGQDRPADDQKVPIGFVHTNPPDPRPRHESGGL